MHIWRKGICYICPSQKDCQIHHRWWSHCEPWSRYWWSSEGMTLCIMSTNHEIWLQFFFFFFFAIDNLGCRLSLFLITMSVSLRCSFLAVSCPGNIRYLLNLLVLWGCHILQWIIYAALSSFRTDNWSISYVLVPLEWKPTKWAI